MQEQLNPYKVIARYPVHWGDMDSANHVNNLVYLRWTESGRIQYFDEIGLSTSFQKEGPILGWQDCKYIFPITFPDTAIIGVRTLEIRQDRLVMEGAVFSEKHQRISAISKQQIIPYSYTELRKIPLPQIWIDRIETLEQKKFN